VLPALPAFVLLLGDAWRPDDGKGNAAPDSNALRPAVARTLQHAKALFAPTRTRVNEQGFVEDVPDEPVVAQEPATAAPPPLADAHAPPAAGAEPLNVAAADKTETR